MYNKTHEPQILMPTNDLNFKRLFASPKHIQISKGFLQDLAEYDPLGYLQITSLEIETPYNFQDVNQLVVDNKYEMLYTEVDYACVDENGVRFMLEMQKNDQKYLEQRIAYNVGQKYAQYYASDVSSDDKYAALQPVIAVIILEDNHFKDDIAIRFLRPHDARHDVYKNNKKLGLEIYIEINKDVGSLPQNLQYWIQYFRTGRVPKCAPDYITEAMVVSELSSLSKEEREIARRIEDAKARRYSEDEATLDKGEAKGRKVEKFEIAKTGVRNGIDVKTISLLTGLSISEIEELEL
jgi:predicted transposase/invertase (TIGR01784 family)